MRKMLAAALLLLTSLLALPSIARTQSAPDAATLQIRQTVFAPSLHVNLDSSYQTWSGTFVRDIVPGSGVPQGLLSKVRIKFRMWLADGQLLADGTVSNPADTVTVGIGRDGRNGALAAHAALIRGLDEGVKGMRLRGVRQLIIPSLAGWGPAGRAGVPPNAVVVAEVTLIEVADGSLHAR